VKLIKKSQARLYGYLCAILGVIFNIGAWELTIYIWDWTGKNPPTGASSGAVGMVLLVMVVPIVLSWIVIAYSGVYLKEAKEV